jgi:CheY-like chemotaxis protein
MAAKILVVDDEPDLELLVRQKFRKQIRAGEYSFVFGQNGIAALEKLAAEPDIDLVLTDINMPEMDGFDLTRAIRQHEAGNSHPRTPIIAMSANVLPGEADRCATAGMDDYIAKPAPMGALAGKLRHWLPHLDWPTAAPPVVNDRPEPSPDGLIDRAVLDEAVRDDAVLDKAVLDELTDGDDDLATSILADYLDSAAADVHSLRDALASATVDDVRRDAHRIKGASATVGATKATALAARLERAASLAVVDWAELRTAVQALEAAIAEASTAVRRTQPA